MADHPPVGIGGAVDISISDMDENTKVPALDIGFIKDFLIFKPLSIDDIPHSKHVNGRKRPGDNRSA
jgi:hypothetical protein